MHLTGIHLNGVAFAEFSVGGGLHRARTGPTLWRCQPHHASQRQLLTATALCTAQADSTCATFRAFYCADCNAPFGHWKCAYSSTCLRPDYPDLAGGQDGQMFWVKRSGERFISRHFSWMHIKYRMQNIHHKTLHLRNVSLYIYIHDCHVFII